MTREWPPDPGTWEHLAYKGAHRRAPVWLYVFVPLLVAASSVLLFGLWWIR